MKGFKINRSLEAYNLGPDQSDIVNYIEDCHAWLTYVDYWNELGVPSFDGEEPCYTWVDVHMLNFNELIESACDALGWESVPQTGGISMSFYLDEELKS